MILKKREQIQNTPSAPVQSYHVLGHTKPSGNHCKFDSGKTNFPNARLILIKLVLGCQKSELTALDVLGSGSNVQSWSNAKVTLHPPSPPLPLVPPHPRSSKFGSPTLAAGGSLCLKPESDCLCLKPSSIKSTVDNFLSTNINHGQRS